MKKSQKLAAVIGLFAVAILAIGPVSHGPWPFPDDEPSGGGNIVAHGPWPFPDDEPSGGGNFHGPWPFPDDEPSGGGNAV